MTRNGHDRLPLPVKVGRLRRRTDFVAMRLGNRCERRAFVLQSRKRGSSAHPDIECVRFGYTVTTRVGNSVQRNRIRRRLREAVRLLSSDCMLAGHDYVLVGKRAALTESFGAIRAQLDKALAGIASRSGNKTGFHATGIED